MKKATMRSDALGGRAGQHKGGTGIERGILGGVKSSGESGEGRNVERLAQGPTGKTDQQRGKRGGLSKGKKKD